MIRSIKFFLKFPLRTSLFVDLSFSIASSEFLNFQAKTVRHYQTVMKSFEHPPHQYIQDIKKDHELKAHPHGLTQLYGCPVLPLASCISL